MKSGVAGGEYFANAGQKNVLCINTLPGTANIEARCKGVIDGITGKAARVRNCRCPRPASVMRRPWPKRSRLNY